MKLHKVSIKSLSNKIDCDFEFNEDINIITGVNGSGKTTLLKILWYAISGNIERISPEIKFKDFELDTSHFSLTLSKRENVINWNYSGKGIVKSGTFDLSNIDPFDEEANELNQLVIDNDTSSLFFPTFRRIEGGYSMTNTRTVRRRMRTGGIITESMMRDDIQDEFDSISSRLSVSRHQFICSISTHDIVSLLTTRYAQSSEKLNEYYLRLSTSIINQIEGVKSDIEVNREEAFNILSELQEKAKDVNRKREELLQPFEVLSTLTAKIFQHKGIQVKSVTLGESVDAIDSGVLSAGEKQMLSFLCYNAFYDNSIIFIDEPELSLHPDWQRRLFPELLKQQASNQFIVATHSPFIYSKYEDKEIIMSKEKGE
jgi:predicted ATP-dependent endonuclease of OLD family